MSKREQSRKLIKKNYEGLFDAGKNLLFEWSTGIGKSLAAINLQARMNSQKTFICVAETAHIENWRKEYIKHGFEYLLKSTEIFCYASLKKYANKSCDLLILDEAHNAASDTRMFILTSLRVKRFIGLSATVSKEHKIFFNDVFKNLTVYTITLEKAIEMELIPKPTVNIILLDLENTKQTEIIEYKRGKTDITTSCNYLQRYSYINNKAKYPALNLTINCTKKQKYEYLDAQYNRAALYKRTGWLRYGGIRKRFLSDCKTDKLMEITSHLTLLDKRFICFCGSIEQSEIIGGNNCIHSKKDAKSIIAKFNSYEINSLYAIKMLTEGQNLPGIEVGIIGQLDGTERPFVQRFGRSLRAEFPEVYILAFRDTKDMDYLKNVTENIPNEFIKYI